MAVMFMAQTHSIVAGAAGGFDERPARAGGDTSRYVSGADALIQGEPLSGKQPAYVSFIAVMAAVRLAGAPYDAIQVVNVLLALIAAWALFDLGRLLCGRGAGFVAAFLFLSNPELALWSSYILTDSFYASLAVLATWSLTRSLEGGKPWHDAAAAAFAIAAALARPNGWLFPPVAMAIWAWRARAWLMRPAVAATAALCVLAAGLALAPKMSRQVALIDPQKFLMEGKILWTDDEWKVAMPPEPELAKTGLAGAAVYVVKHPAACLKLAAVRVAASVWHVREGFSARHKIFHYLTLPPILALAAFGFWRTRQKQAVLPALAVLAGHLAIVAATFADIDGRFFLYYSPVIFLFAGCGTAALVSRPRRP